MNQIQEKNTKNNFIYADFLEFCEEGPYLTIRIEPISILIDELYFCIVDKILSEEGRQLI